MERFLFATDLHGHEPSYAALTAAAERLRADAVVLGGDILPNVAPAPSAQIAWARSFLRSWLDGMRDVAAVFAILGNDDPAPVADELDRWEEAGFVRHMHMRRGEFVGRWLLFGYACVPPTPFGIKDWERRDCAADTGPLPVQVSPPFRTHRGGREPIGDFAAELRARPSIEEDLAGLPRTDWDRTIVVAHTPPADTALDRLYDGRSVGSRALRVFLTEAGPPLSFHGHIHESPRVSGRIEDRVGRTRCFNPGASNRRLRALLAEFRDGAWEVVAL